MINYSPTEDNVPQNLDEARGLVCQEQFPFSPPSPPRIIKYLLIGIKAIKLGMEGNVLCQGDFLISYSQPGNGLARQSKAAA